jgi:enamine deaminase RidA (YjgF/YER057c/UK114 family)
MQRTHRTTTGLYGARHEEEDGVEQPRSNSLEAAGGSLKDITFNHIFLTDMSNYAGMNEVYREYFPKDPPARYCIRADLVKPGFLVEIASIAHLPR